MVRDSGPPFILPDADTNARGATILNHGTSNPARLIPYPG